jgi:hypothetical protein
VAGILSIDDVTDSTTTTTGSVHTDGGLGVAKDCIFGNDVKLKSDGAVLSLGDGADFSITHDGGTGAAVQAAGALSLTTVAGNLTVDCSNSIFLDSDSGNIVMKDDGQAYATFTHVATGDLTIATVDLVLDCSGDITLDAAGGNINLTTGILSVDDTTGSSSTTTGSIHTDGGLGVVQNLHVGGTTTVAGILSIDDVTDSTTTTTGSVHTDGGLGVAKDCIFGNDVKLKSDSAVLSLGDGADFTLTHDGTTGGEVHTAGALRLATDTGNINMYCGSSIVIDAAAAIYLNADNGLIYFKDDSQLFATFTHVATGDLTIATVDLVLDCSGDITLDAAGGNINLTTGILSVDDTTQSTSTTTGSVHTDGGLGVAKNLHVGGTTTCRGITAVGNWNLTSGILSVDDTTDSTSNVTGSIHTDGGLGVAKNIVCGGTAGLRAKFITNYSGATGLTIDLESSNTGTGLIKLRDNMASALDITQSTNSYLKFVTTNSSEAVNIGKNTNVTGAITATADITAYYSDPRLKNFHGRIPDPIGKLRKLNGYYFTANEVAQKLGFTDTRMQVGLNSAEVESVMPEIVRPAPIDATFNTVQYEKMVPLLIEVCKAQQRQIEALAQKIASFK